MEKTFQYRSEYNICIGYSIAYYFKLQNPLKNLLFSFINSGSLEL